MHVVSRDVIWLLSLADSCHFFRTRQTCTYLTPLASHRGIARPLAEFAGVCRDLGVPLVVDVAAFGARTGSMDL